MDIMLFFFDVCGRKYSEKQTLQDSELEIVYIFKIRQRSSFKVRNKCAQPLNVTVLRGHALNSDDTALVDQSLPALPATKVKVMYL